MRVGVNFHDVYVRSGPYSTLPLPGIPGIGATGAIEDCGRSVRQWKPGDRVACVTGACGVYATERLIDASQRLSLPATLPDDVAASALLRGPTVEMLRRRVHVVRPGSRILVQAAAGGVGQLLCQWAAHLAAQVIGTVTAEAKAAGCRFTIDSSREDVVQQVRELTNGRGVEVACDGVGQASFFASLAALDDGGHSVKYGQASGAVPPFEVSRLAARSNSLTRPTAFRHVRGGAQG